MKLGDLQLPAALRAQVARSRAASKPRTIAIVSTFTAGLVEESIALWMTELQLPAKIVVAGYDQVFQELLGGDGAFAQNDDGVNVVLVRVEDWLGRGVELASVDDAVLARVRRNGADLVDALARPARLPRLLVLCPSSPALRAHAALREALLDVERTIERGLASATGVDVVTSHVLGETYPIDVFYDAHSDELGHVPYTREMFAALGTMIVRRVWRMQHAPYKVLVLDCDNTLWKGICGEDGPDGVTLEDGRDELQRFVVAQQAAGVLVCLCSKNNEPDVWSVFARRPEMPLRPEHIVAWRIDWRPKSVGLRELASDLALGLDGFVFLDDNAQEVAEIAAQCPEVLALQVPSTAAGIEQLLRETWGFDRRAATDEDRRRTELYRENAQRERLRSATSSLADFLASLELEVAIDAVAPGQLERVAQLTEKTNQFNTSTRRRTRAELEQELAAGRLECLTVHVRDRFGDYGLVGVVLHERREHALFVDSLMLSCRVLGKGVEHRVLNRLATVANGAGLPAVEIRYVRTPRSTPARTFLESLEARRETTEDGVRFFVATATAAAARPMESVASDVGQAAPKPEGVARSAAVLARALEALGSPRRVVERLRTQRRARSDGPVEYVAPRDDAERRIAEIWADLLHVERVGAHDNFFDLGGHSLLGTQVMSRLRNELGATVPLRVLFEAPTVAGLAARARQARVHDAPRLVIAPRGTRPPLSFAQERLWFLDQLEPGSAVYNMPMPLRLKGALDLGALRGALDEIMRRHESLRTTFSSDGGLPFQVVHPATSLALEPEPLAREHASRAVAEELQRPFDLERGPLARVRLFRVGPEEHLLVATTHHIVSDGWSLGVLVRELAALYGAFVAGKRSPLPELPLQYIDYAIEQRDRLQGDTLAQEVDHWREALAGAAAVIELPTDRPRPAVRSFAGRRVPVNLPHELLRKLRELALAEGASLYMTLMAAWQLVLSRWSGQDDVVVGVLSANRNREELEGLIGFFVNDLALRLDLRGRPSFRVLLQRCKAALLDAYAHDELPFERVLEAVSPPRSTSWTPLFQVLFTLANMPTRALTLPELVLEQLPVGEPAAEFDLMLTLNEHADSVGGHLIYAVDLFDETTALRLVEGLVAVLHAAVATPDLEIARLTLVDEPEARRIAAYDATARPYAPRPLVHEQIAAQAARTPDAIAVRCEGVDLTYGVLDARAEELASSLRGLGVGPDVLVGLCVERSSEMMVGLLAVWKAGGAYVPIDPAYPADRIAYMLRDARPDVLLTQARLLTRLPASDARVVCLEGPWPEGASAPRAPGSPQSLAYMIYTSGSTGRPKGAMNAHAGILNRLHWMQEVYALDPDDVVLQKTPISFDVSVWELFWPLMIGARLVVAKPGGHHDPAYLEALIEVERVTTLHFVPSMLASFLDQPDLLRTCASLRRVMCSGEALPLELQQRAFAALPAHVALHNLYGPTEAAVDVTAWACERQSAQRSVPIGRPIANTQMRVLDAELGLVPTGVSGELFIAGVQVGRGYHARPDLTAERFVPDPFAAEPGARMYRTGDVGRWRTDGALDYLGRTDHQVKLRGFRIELGEIEAALRACPEVADAAVQLYAPPVGEPRLVAYVVGRQLHEGAVVSDEALNLVGWNDSYTGAPLPVAEMREWVDSIVDGVLAEKPRRVLELGVGAGLLLFRIAPHVDRYEATDLAKSTIERLQRDLAVRPIAGVALRQAEATDFTGIEPGSFDAVVLNSVAQYFPSGAYLTEVLERAVEAVRPGGFVYIGDVRNLELEEAFAASVFAARGSVESTEREITERVADEDELLVSPAFFHALAARLPRIGAVELRLKRGRAHNELTAFRYEAILRVGARPVAGETQIVDWRDLDSVRALLESRPEVLLVRRVPNARVADAVALIGKMRGEPEDRTLFVEPEDVWALEREAPYRVELSWASCDASGAFDVVLTRNDVEPRAHSVPPGASRLVNEPSRGETRRRIVAALKARLAAALPEHMVPSTYVVLEKLPLSANGKLDRSRLPAPHAPESTRAYVAPSGPRELLLADIWRDLLHVERVGAHDDFFELGGHSLLAMQVVAQVRRQLGVELPVRAIFEARTVACLARRLEGRTAQSRDVPLVPVDRTGELPLGFAQEPFWDPEKVGPRWSALFHQALPMRIVGSLSPALVERAFQALVARQESLRTSFHATSSSPVARVAPTLAFELPLVDLSSLTGPARAAEVERRVAELVLTPLEYERAPMFRVALFQLAPNQHLLVLVVHHIISDTWSAGIFLRELVALYTAFAQGQASPLAALPIQAGDHAVWSRLHMTEERRASDVEFWRDALRGAPRAIPLPLVASDGPVTVETVMLTLDRRVAGVITGSQSGPFVTMASALAAVLHVQTGASDLTIGTVYANRDRAELADLIGCFVNFLPLRSRAQEADTLGSLRTRFQQVTLAAFDHADFPFERIVEAVEVPHKPNGNPLYNVAFELNDFRQVPDSTATGLVMELVELPLPRPEFRVDLLVIATITRTETRLSFTFKRQSLEPEFVQRLAALYRTVLEASFSRPEQRLDSLARLG